ncbi:MAG TPA: HypC/HybG/HupF family hydrogenase formation chaperone [Myxococcota bacterium]|nr:HypC/HybG/HupF family hydrogenase formation chaperone [Myxococcota bacterium]
MCLAVPGRVLEVADEAGVLMARVDFGGVRKRVCLETLPDARPGDFVLVHAGFALQVLDEAAAEATLRLAAEMEERR